MLLLGWTYHGSIMGLFLSHFGWFDSVSLKLPLLTCDPMGGVAHRISHRLLLGDVRVVESASFGVVSLETCVYSRLDPAKVNRIYIERWFLNQRIILISKRWIHTVVRIKLDRRSHHIYWVLFLVFQIDHRLSLHDSCTLLGQFLNRWLFFELKIRVNGTILFLEILWFLEHLLLVLVCECQELGFLFTIFDMSISGFITELSQTYRTLDARKHFWSCFNISLRKNLVGMLLGTLFGPFFDLCKWWLHQVFRVQFFICSLLEAADHRGTTPYERLASSMSLPWFIKRLDLTFVNASSRLIKIVLLWNAIICVLSTQDRIVNLILLLQRRNIPNWTRLERPLTLKWAIRLLS